ncbi:uncharacterized protein LOC144884318 isoform X1 [Branchiostoma floridae x Branchiostoma japonicum]
MGHVGPGAKKQACVGPGNSLASIRKKLFVILVREDLEVGPQRPNQHSRTTGDSTLHGEETCDCGGACNCHTFTSNKEENCDLPVGRIRDAIRSKRAFADDVPS